MADPVVIDGRAWLNVAGRFESVPAENLQAALDQIPNSRLATAEEVQQRIRQREQEGMIGGAVTAAEQAGMGLLSGLTAPARIAAAGLGIIGEGATELGEGLAGLVEDAPGLPGTIARGLMAPITGALGALGAAGEFGRDFAAHSTPQQFRKDIGYLTGGYEGEQAYLERARAQQEAWPLLSTLSYGVGQAVGMAPALFAGGAAAATTRLGMAAAGAAEGAAGGILAPYEEASLYNTPVDRSAVLASGLIGAALGGAVGAAAPTIGRVVARGREGLARVFGRPVQEAVERADDAATRAAKAMDAAAAQSADDAIRRVAPDAPEGVAEQVKNVRQQLQSLREQVAKAADEAGPNPIAKEEAVAKALDNVDSQLRDLAGEITEETWDKEMSDLAYLHFRDDIIEFATRRMARDLDETLQKTQIATEPVRTTPLKRQLVAKNLADIDAAQAISEAQKRAQARLNKVIEFENSPDFKESKRTVRSLKKIAETSVQTLGEVDNAADAYLAEDAARRALLRHVPGLGYASRGPDAVKNTQAQALLDWVLPEYEQTAEFLFDPQIWGRQGEIQARVNRAWVGAIDASHIGIRNFTAPGSRDIFNRIKPRADFDKIRAYLDRLGSASLRDIEFRRILDTQDELLAAIREGYELDGAALKSLDESREAIARMRKTLEVAEDRVYRANIQKKLNDAELQAIQLGGRTAGALFGLARSGVRGAVVGGLIPGGTAGALRTAEAVQTLSDTTRGRLASFVARTLAKLAGADTAVGKAATKAADTVRRTKMLTPDGERVAERVRKWALSSAPFGGTAHRLFERTRDMSRNEQKQRYRERREILASLQANPEQANAAAAKALGPIIEMNPSMGSLIVMDMLGKLDRLHQAFPGRLELSPAPKANRDVVSDQELRQAEAMWEATVDPWSVFEDFEKGVVDYDKVAFAREQHPELFEMARAAMLDVMAQLPEMPPEHVVNQLDLLLGFNGQLAQSYEPGFLARIGSLGPMLRQQVTDNQPRPVSRPPRVPSANPTRTQRLMLQ